EDGIRDWSVTGVQTCALPISPCAKPWAPCAKAQSSYTGKSWTDGGKSTKRRPQHAADARMTRPKGTMRENESAGERDGESAAVRSEERRVGREGRAGE